MSPRTPAAPGRRTCVAPAPCHLSAVTHTHNISLTSVSRCYHHFTLRPLEQTTVSGHTTHTSVWHQCQVVIITLRPLEQRTICCHTHQCQGVSCDTHNISLTVSRCQLSHTHISLTSVSRCQLSHTHTHTHTHTISV